MNRRAIIVVFLALLTSVTTAEGQKTTRRGLKAAEQTAVTDDSLGIQSDTIRNPVDILTASGYDKPLTSRKESLHLTNNGDARIVAVGLTITYTDFRGTELHKRTVNLKCDVPPHATRLVTFPSWDVQNSFYYEGSTKPRRQAYPYGITLTADYIVTRDD